MERGNKMHMTLGKRTYWALALVALLALAGAAVTVTSRLASAGGPDPTPAAHASDQQDDDASEAAIEGVDADNDDASEAVAEGIDANDDDASEAVTEAADTNGIEVRDGDQNQAGEVEDNEVQAPTGQIDDGKDLLPQAGITLDQAISAAGSAASGSVGEVDLEHYQGKLVFNVDVGDKDVKVDASNGAVLSADADD
jgi:uncharacterized membrane protein YkoI